jgi:hypothetical protein
VPSTACATLQVHSEGGVGAGYVPAAAEPRQRLRAGLAWPLAASSELEREILGKTEKVSSCLDSYGTVGIHNTNIL